MQIAASTNSIVDEIRSLTDTDTTSYPIADVIRRVNIAYEELIGEIINADGVWQYDDTNHTDLPRGTGTLVEGQQTYSFASEYLQITMIEIKDNNGFWRKIEQIDPSDLKDESPDERFGLKSDGNPNTGFPLYYDVLGDTIFLYPAPTATNVTLASGLRVWFKRTVDLFTTADTTQSPGLPSTHHVLLAYMAAQPYNMLYHADRVLLIQKKIDEMRKSLIAHYSVRNRDKRKVATMAPISFR